MILANYSQHPLFYSLKGAIGWNHACHYAYNGHVYALGNAVPIFEEVLWIVSDLLRTHCDPFAQRDLRNIFLAGNTRQIKR